MHELGVRLRELRKSKGWTQKQLAEQIHKSTAAIGSYEQNVQIPPSDVLISLARIYHLSLDELVGIESEAHFVVSGLTKQQKDVIEALLDEYAMPSGKGKKISDNQKKIINMLFCTFLDQE